MMLACICAALLGVRHLQLSCYAAEASQHNVNICTCTSLICSFPTTTANAFQSAPLMLNTALLALHCKARLSKMICVQQCHAGRQ